MIQIKSDVKIKSSYSLVPLNGIGFCVFFTYIKNKEGSLSDIKKSGICIFHNGICTENIENLLNKKTSLYLYNEAMKTIGEKEITI